MQLPTQPRQPLPGGHAGGDDSAAETSVHSDQGLQIGDIDQVALVNDDDGCDLSLGGAHQESVDQRGLQRGIVGRRDNRYLSDIGNQDVLLVLMATGQHPLPRLHTLDHSVLAILRLEQHVVTGNDGVTGLASDRADDSTNGALIPTTRFHLSSISLNDALRRPNRGENPSTSTQRFIDIDDDVFPFEMGTDNGPLASLISLAGDALTAIEIVDVDSLGMHRARDVVSPRRVITVLAKVDS
eukprot:TRINITY_DN761_c1_g1_i7.p1 TRINITY_DN761_c1_g1~~TRINITY_DN761_c1_g1_i7.p1  ORF type:complete len:241 (+),score=36.43 TRINITY_DN761_c1_g1_i7:828-1550(+)